MCDVKQILPPATHVVPNRLTESWYNDSTPKPDNAFKKSESSSCLWGLVAGMAGASKSRFEKHRDSYWRRRQAVNLTFAEDSIAWGAPRITNRSHRRLLSALAASSSVNPTRNGLLQGILVDGCHKIATVFLGFRDSDCTLDAQPMGQLFKSTSGHVGIDTHYVHLCRRRQDAQVARMSGKSRTSRQHRDIRSVS